MKKGFLIDMDGVIYSGNDLIPGADIFISELQKREIPFLFMTNNSQRTALDTVLKVKKMGINIKENNVYNSAMATAWFLSFIKPKGTAYVLGEGGLISSLTDVGYQLVDKNADYVVLGEGINFTLEMVNKAVEMILAGARFIATNLDPSPRKTGWNNLGIKAVVAMIEEATGVTAFSVGKPSPVMMRASRKKLGLTAEETIIIGDTLATDILGGIQLGYKTILTLSGVTKLDDLSKSVLKPSLIVNSCAEIDLDKVLEDL